MTKDITACKLPVGPRDFFSFNPALWALDSAHGNLFDQVEKTMDLLYTKYLKALIEYERLQRLRR